MLAERSTLPMSTEPMLSATRFGEMVRQYRRQEGLSQSQLADRVGVGREAIAEIESGKTENPKLMTALALCRILGITPNEMAQAFGFWHGRALDNETIDRQLAMTLSNLEALAQRLTVSEQVDLDGFLSKIVDGYRTPKR